MSTAKTPPASLTEMVQFVLPNDANVLGFILGGTVMHLIDIAGAIAATRHTRSQVVTASVDDLQFLHPIHVDDMIILRAWVNAAFHTSMEVEVEVCSEGLAGERQTTSRAFLTFLTFVAVDTGGHPQPVPPLELETEDERARANAAQVRRKERLRRRLPSV
jgi:acyl-CoA hydrolase